MQQTAWTQRIVREVEFGRFRYALLGLLLGVGLVFWVPQLQQLSLTSSSASIPLDVTARRTTPRPAVEATTSFVNDRQRPSGEQSTLQNSAHVPAATTDPVARSVEMVAIPGKMLQSSANPERPSRGAVRLGSLEVKVVSASSDVQATDAGTPPGLTVQDTIIGVQRRAVVVNNQLYFEGDIVVAGSQHYRIASVEKGLVTMHQLPAAYLTEQDVRPANSKLVQKVEAESTDRKNY